MHPLKEPHCDIISSGENISPTRTILFDHSTTIDSLLRSGLAQDKCHIYCRRYLIMDEGVRGLCQWFPKL